ncbi:beta-glycosyltransferase [Bacterioplanes sanyensis]|uniref:glycosyltransferase family 2 protein n=1 Tax=Bacterioplanes sanyensis TaxID=1249553 RepID=UPI001673FDE8|nr:glycosyltransferase family A protein [Bacterioplanes sanyensis]GGY52992.1 beta-glycosyltransferase [Bacterioplanes sanyensis]
MSTSPSFLVAVPTFNRAHLLPRVMESIARQDYDNWRVLFVDDASSDNTAEVIAGYQQQYPNRIHYVCMAQNSGVNAVRNRIIEEAMAIAAEDFIVWIDDDDYLAPQCLEQAAAAIEAQPGYVWYTLDCIHEDGSYISRIREYGEMSYLRDYMFGKRMRGDMTHVVKASAIGDVRFCTQFRNAEVWYFWSQLAACYPLYAVAKPGSVKEYLPDGITQKGFNRDKAIAVLQLKIATLEPLVGRKPLLHQYTTLAKHYYNAGDFRAARRCLTQVLTSNPGYVRQYPHWLKLGLRSLRPG